MIVPACLDFATTVQEEREVAAAGDLGDIEQRFDELGSIRCWDRRTEPEGPLGVQAPGVGLAKSVDSDGVLPAARDLRHEAVQ